MTIQNISQLQFYKDQYQIRVASHRLARGLQKVNELSEKAFSSEEFMSLKTLGKSSFGMLSEILNRNPLLVGESEIKELMTLQNCYFVLTHLAETMEQGIDLFAREAAKFDSVTKTKFLASEGFQKACAQLEENRKKQTEVLNEVVYLTHLKRSNPYQK